MKLRPLSIVFTGLMIVAMVLSACAPACRTGAHGR